LTKKATIILRIDLNRCHAHLLQVMVGERMTERAKEVVMIERALLLGGDFCMRA